MISLLLLGLLLLLSEKSLFFNLKKTTLYKSQNPGKNLFQLKWDQLIKTVLILSNKNSQLQSYYRRL